MWIVATQSFTTFSFFLAQIGRTMCRTVHRGCTLAIKKLQKIYQKLFCKNNFDALTWLTSEIFENVKKCAKFMW